MKILTNTISLQAQRNLQRTTEAIARTLDSLASGKRITSARIDASGLAVASGLEAQRRGIGQAIRNINDGRGFLQTADGAIATMGEMIQRMRELALQAANGTLGASERSYLQVEMSQLLEEFDRIVSDTTFNGVALLDGSFETKTLQVGPQAGHTIPLALQSMRSHEIFTHATGNFEFTAGEQFNVPGSSDILRADFNEDGIDDVAYVGGDLRVDLLDENGNTTSTFNDGVTSTGIGAVGDFNGDGNLDIAVGYNADGVDIRLGDGNGGFASSEVTMYSGNLMKMEVQDFNNDGEDDLLLYDNTTGGFATLIRNGSGFDLEWQNSIYDASAQSDIDGAFNSQFRNLFELEDFDQDGILDLLTSKGISRGNGDGSFGDPMNAGQVWDAGVGFQLIDANGSGPREVIVSTNDGLYLGEYRNGEFSYRTLDDDNHFYARAGDIDGDGDEDFVTHGLSGGKSFSFYENDGAGNFSRVMWMDAELGRDTELGDQNADGVMDLLHTLPGGETFFFNQEHPERSALELMNISTQAKAQDSLRILQTAQDKILQARANIGANMSRLDVAQGVLSLTNENIAAAQSQIEDVDIAMATAELAKLQVLQQAQIAVLGQANAEMRMVLSLLDDYRRRR